MFPDFACRHIKPFLSFEGPVAMSPNVTYGTILYTSSLVKGLDVRPTCVKVITKELILFHPLCKGRTSGKSIVYILS